MQITFYWIKEIEWKNRIWNVKPSECNTNIETESNQKRKQNNYFCFIKEGNCPKIKCHWWINLKLKGKWYWRILGRDFLCLKGKK